MDPGVSALIGAVVGGITTLGGSWLSQRGLAKNERDRQRREDGRAALIAARILQEELVFAEARIEQALKHESYWAERSALRRDAWLEYRESIAVALDDAEWSIVRDGFRATQAAELDAARIRDIRGPGSPAPLTPEGRELLEAHLDRVRGAVKTLVRVGGERLEPFAEDQSGEDELPVTFDQSEDDLGEVPEEVVYEEPRPDKDE